MLLFPHYISKSTIHGLGVFSEVDISKGEKVWSFDDRFDKLISPADLEGLPMHTVEWIKSRASYCDQRKSFVLGSDGDLFMNHSDAPNLAGGGV